MKYILGFACLLMAGLPSQAQTAGEVRGSVVDARGGEALSNVQVSLVGGGRATTDAQGKFDLQGVAPGEYVLNVSTVGYHLLKKPFTMAAGDVKEFEVVLTPDTLRQTDNVEVQAGPFEAVHQDSPSTLALAGNDAKNLASVLADDPLRAVQDLPGVSSNNDFDARFSVRGADFSRIGIYLDGVLLHEPFHTLEGQNMSGSGTAFNGDMVEEMELQEGAFPERYGDRSASVLDVTTREGSRTDTMFRVAASVSNAGVIAEGPLGKKKRGSWLVAVRKSYLQYLLERTFPNTTLIFGLEDAQGRLSYDLTPKNHLTFYVLESYSGLDRSSVKSRLGVNSLMEAGYHYTLGNFGWQSTPTNTLIVTSHAAWMREKYGDTNPKGVSLGAGYYGEWVWNTTATWMWSPAGSLDAGFSARRIRDGGYSQQFDSSLLRVHDSWDGTANLDGGYVQQSYAALRGHIRLTAGVRWDHHSVDGVTATSPAASAAISLTKSTHLQLGYGQYVQFPELSILNSTLGNRGLPPMRSNQAIAALEQRLGERTRVRVETYNRADRDLIYQPFYDPRLIAGKVFTPPLLPQFANSLRGYSRGVEIFLQRSSANRFTGWVSYGFGRTQDRDGISGVRFPSAWDQRHTINIYGGYRLRPSVNLSARSSWGSGFPIPGFLVKTGSSYYLTSVRNSQSLGAYNRTDLRINKAWTRDKWKLTLYGEVVNLTNRTNYVFESLDSFNSKTGQAYVTVDTMFPVLPSAGIVFER
ncbi:MAG TPA: TonB-dependent receptor [Bryobacteraceae bacterium]|nr:TonB-dependent receptor [Bryobacteraceae bacterium]